MRIGTICVGHMGGTVLVIGPSSGTTCGSQTRAAPGRSPQPVKTGWLSSPGTNSARKVAEVFHGFVGSLKNRSGLS